MSTPARPGEVLSHSLVQAPGGHSEGWIVFLHGIFGSGSNWRTFARRVVAVRPRWGALLVDLRMHGASQSFAPPHTVAACAQDVRALVATLHAPAIAVVGHSFGGKVALELLAQGAGAIAHAIIVDSGPGTRPDARGSESTQAVLARLEAMPGPFASREDFVARWVADGYGADIAQWLAMNLKREGEAFALRTDLVSIRALLDDYFARDLWPVVEHPPAGVDLHLVLGGRSAIYDAADRDRVERAARERTNVHVHTLERAGHWVHVDDPDGLFAVVCGAIPA